MDIFIIYQRFVIFSGELAHVGVGIEECTGKVWDMIFQPMLNKVSDSFYTYSSLWKVIGDIVLEFEP